jgi:hypothetical protein
MVSCFQFSRKQTVTSFEFVSRDMFSHFIMFYILNKIKAYDLCNSGGFGYRWVEFRKPNTPISTRLNPKMCDWKPDDPQWPAHLTIFRFGLFGLNRFADFYSPLISSRLCIVNSILQQPGLIPTINFIDFLLLTWCDVYLLVCSLALLVLSFLWILSLFQKKKKNFFYISVIHSIFYCALFIKKYILKGEIKLDPLQYPCSTREDPFPSTTHAYL